MRVTVSSEGARCGGSFVPAGRVSLHVSERLYCFVESGVFCMGRQVMESMFLMLGSEHVFSSGFLVGGSCSCLQERDLPRVCTREMSGASRFISLLDERRWLGDAGVPSHKASVSVGI